MILRLILGCGISVGIAQAIKIITKWCESKRFDWYILFESGGMPSAHSSFVTALCTGLYFDQGITPLFVASCVFSMIILRDSMGIRRAAGEHAQLLNLLLREVKKTKQIKAQQVKVLLGHTPTQVVVGTFLGFIVALLVSVL